MTWAAYREYWSTGVEGIGDIPRDWAPTRLRHLLVLNPPVPAALRCSNDEVSFLPMELIGEDGSLDLSRTRPVQEVLTGYSYFTNGDVLFAKVTPCFENGKAALVRKLPSGHGFGTTEVTTLRPGPRLDQEFLGYLIRSDRFRQSSIAAMTGAGGLKRVPDKQVRDFYVALPPLGDQRKITNFLDVETEKIDTLIAKQEQLVATLREDRHAQLLNLVAHGCDPSTALKSCDLGWVEGVPCHWAVVNIRRVALMKTGHTPSRSVVEYWENTTIPWFTLADVWQLRDGLRTYLGETTERISELGLANSAAELLPAGTVVLSRTASVGFTGIMPAPMATSQDYWNWVCGPRILPEYLMYTFRAMQSYFAALMMGSTHKTIYQADAAAIRIPLPPLSEQQDIVREVISRTAAIDDLVAKAVQMVGVLREYRSALITDAVTGKIDVREAVA